jgi:hypothetical protein
MTTTAPSQRRLHRALVALLARALAMRRGFFGVRSPDSPRTSVEDAAEDEEGLDAPKNRRRLPKQARAQPLRARGARGARCGGKSPFSLLVVRALCVRLLAPADAPHARTPSLPADRGSCCIRTSR